MKDERGEHDFPGSLNQAKTLKVYGTGWRENTIDQEGFSNGFARDRYLAFMRVRR